MTFFFAFIILQGCSLSCLLASLSQRHNFDIGIQCRQYGQVMHAALIGLTRLSSPSARDVTLVFFFSHSPTPP
ncbi:unnamed protein product [Periconia digitata]|uniref:Secreted protein n=1 Tax=Periconia digitata TaxID=1303443 RepID=A0A9W4XSU5_9PLEO|nr:unnamed protein product [Periconia digitata]